MADNRNFVCLDFETGGVDTKTTEILQIGAVAINRNSLKIVDKFETKMKPDDFDLVQDGALAVNGLTREELREAPEASVMFPTFANWLRKHNIHRNKSSFGAPIAMTWNGDRFDIPILNRYCEKYGFWDKKWKSGTLVNPVFSFDVQSHMWFWTRVNPDMKNNKLVTTLQYMGVSEEEIEAGAHDALWDVEWTAEIGVRLLKIGVHMTGLRDDDTRRLEFANALKSVPSKVRKDK